ncbi:hypothetical protein Bhyg_03496 [Pseudolycoriella hygida]|uniref:Uncharacterized protein n=1 Tax=Pseudolycoriella hygida TaxID=35572 RepID=A0A9Q0NDT8_9DIPT|nr:hypothetical protein Bhyg_03496 [Pseudolycoriella hygida]
MNLFASAILLLLIAECALNARADVRCPCVGNQMEKYCPSCPTECNPHCGCLFPVTGEELKPRPNFHRPDHCGVCAVCLNLPECSVPLPQCNATYVQKLIGSAAEVGTTDFHECVVKTGADVRCFCAAIQMEKYCPSCPSECNPHCGCLFPGTGEELKPRKNFHRPEFCGVCAVCLNLPECSVPLPVCSATYVQQLIGTPPEAITT